MEKQSVKIVSKIKRSVKPAPGPSQRRLPGRPKLFNREDVLRQAMHVFWSKGYQEASYADLIKAMGMTAPSIYLAFGSKEKLFEEAFQLYLEEEATGLKALAQPLTAKASIESMLKSVVRAFTSFETPRGCMSIVGSMSLPAEQGQLRKTLQETRQATLLAIQQKLDVAVKTGELQSMADTQKISCLCRTMWSGLSLQILDGVSRSELYGAIDLFVNMIGFEA